jgi:Uma2 family endonuclease
MGRGGPGRWVILDKIEVQLGEHLLVLDLADWRKERFPGDAKENWSVVAPDWVCEVLLPGTVRVDKVRKLPIYAEHQVAHLWLIDPNAKTLEVYRLESGRRLLLGTFTEQDKVRAEPFQQVEIELRNLRLD